MNMYEVCAKCGHVGRNYYVEKTFAVEAETKKAAAAIVRNMPRVKHHHSDAIRYVEEIDKYRYCEIINMNKEDPYFSCYNIQEQRRTCDLTLQEEDGHNEDRSRTIKAEQKPVFHGKVRIRNPKKYYNKYAISEAA